MIFKNFLINRLFFFRVKFRITLILLFMIISSGPSYSQFINLSFEVESEVVAEVMNPLSFGQVIPNIGLIRIPLGDPDMGVFSVSGPRNIVVEMNMDIPNYLEFNDGNNDFRIPMDLEVSLANRNENNIEHAEPVHDHNIRFSLYDDPVGEQLPDISATIATAFIYVYGQIEIGDIPAGTYDADVYLTVEYE